MWSYMYVELKVLNIFLFMHICIGLQVATAKFTVSISFTVIIKFNKLYIAQ